MATWTCPKCSRTFGAIGRGHMCTPGLSVEQFLEGSPDFARPVFERVRQCLVDVDDELVDWLAEAYHLGDPEAADARRGDEASPSSDPMLPDDIDFEITPSNS